MITAFLSELKYTLKNRTTLVILFVLPILINTAIGFVFINGKIQHIPMAIADLDNSTLSRTITQNFIQADEFNIKYHPQNQEEIQKLMDSSSIRVGMVIPKDFSSQVTKGESPAILMIYDGSHMSIVSIAKAKASEILLTIKAGAEIKMLEGKLSMSPSQALKLVQDLSFETRVLYNPAKNFSFFLNPGFTAAASQTAIVLICAVCMRRKDFEKPLRSGFNVLGKVLFYSVCGTFTLYLCILMQSLLFNIPFNGSHKTAVYLSFMLSLCATSFSVFTSAFIAEQGLAMLVNAALFLPCTVLVGYTWPTMSMPPIYQQFAPLLPFYHYADNIRLLYLKGVPSTTYNADMVWMGQFSLIFTALAFLSASVRSVIRKYILQHHSVIHKNEGVSTHE